MNALTAKEKAEAETGVEKRRLDKVKGQLREEDLCIKNVTKISKKIRK